MKHRAFTIVSAAWLLLLIAVLVLWVMSYTASAGARHLRLELAARGGTQLHRLELRDGMLEYRLWRRTTPLRGRAAYVHAWNLPVPIAALGAALLCTTLVLIRWQRRLSRCDRAGVCPRCGYDLRATPERCPECGHVSAAAPDAN